MQGWLCFLSQYFFLFLHHRENDTIFWPPGSSFDLISQKNGKGDSEISKEKMKRKKQGSRRICIEIS